MLCHFFSSGFKNFCLRIFTKSTLFPQKSECQTRKVLDQMVIYESLKIWYLIGSLLTLPKAFWPQQPQYRQWSHALFRYCFLNYSVGVPIFRLMLEIKYFRWSNTILKDICLRQVIMLIILFQEKSIHWHYFFKR